MFMQKKAFGDVLVDNGVITQEQLEHARDVQKSAPGDLAVILQDLGFAGEREIASARADSLGLQFVDLTRTEIEQKATESVPEHLVKRYNILPIKKDSSSDPNTLMVAVGDIERSMAGIEDMRLISRCQVTPVLAAKSDIEDAIARVYGDGTAHGAAVTGADGAATTVVKDDLLTIDEAAKFLGTSKSTLYRLLSQGEVKGTKVGKQWRFRAVDLKAYLGRSPESFTADPGMKADLEAFLKEHAVSDNLEEVSEEAAIIRIAHAIIQEAVRQGVSDIHLEGLSESYRVRYRIDGVLQESMNIPKTAQKALVARFKIMADLNIMENRLPQDGRIPIKTDGKDYDLRIGFIPTFFGENVTMRILNRSEVLVGLEKLAISDPDVSEIRNWLHRKRGMIIATGPSNSGRTTLLYSGLMELTSEGKKIVTIEDPVEYQIPGASQTQVNKRAGMTFAVGLHALQHQDPDVILVSEMRDIEALQVSVEAALTGRLVLSTLHVDSAPAALVRMANMGVEETLANNVVQQHYLIGDTVIGVVAMRLGRRLCDACKTPVDPNDRDLLSKVAPLSKRGGYAIPPDAVLFEPVGCHECRMTGYRGQVAMHEVLSCDPKLTARILACPTTEEMTDVAVQSGMRTVLADGMAKAVAGETSVAEVLRATSTWL